MRFPYTTLLAFTLAWVLATALPTFPSPPHLNPKRSLHLAQPLARADSHAVQQAERERKDWGRRLLKRQVVSETATAATSFVLAETSTTSEAARTTETTTTAATTTSTTTSSAEETTSSTTTTPASSLTTTASSIATSSSSSAESSSTSPSSSSASAASSSTIRSSSSSASSALPSSSAAAASTSSSIFTPSNRLFALGVVLIIAIIVVGLLSVIYILKRFCRTARFADERDYPNGFPTPFLDDKALSKRYSHQSQVGLLNPHSPPSPSPPSPGSPPSPSGMEDAKELDMRYIEFGQQRVGYGRPASAPLAVDGPPRWSSLSTNPLPPSRPLPESLKSTPLPPLPLPPRSSSAPPPPHYSRPVSPPRGHRKPLPPLAILQPQSAPLQDRYTVSPRQSQSHARRGASHQHSPPRGSRLREEI